MEIRRRILMQIGGNAMIGSLSKYQQVKITPSSVSDLMFTHDLKTMPKVIVITSPDASEPYTAEGYIRAGILSDICGCVQYHNKANHNIIVGGISLVSSESSVANSNYYISSTIIKIHQVSGNGTWSINTEYTFDIYA